MFKELDDRDETVVTRLPVKDEKAEVVATKRAKKKKKNFIMVDLRVCVCCCCCWRLWFLCLLANGYWERDE